MPPTILGRWLVIGMLNKAGKGVARIAGVDPIAIGKLAIQGEYETLRAICLAPIIAGTIIVWQGGYEATGKTGRHGRDDTIGRPGPLTGVNLPTPIIQRLDCFHAGTK